MKTYKELLIAINEDWVNNFKESLENRDRETKLFSDENTPFKVVLDSGKKDYYEKNKIDYDKGCIFDSAYWRDRKPFSCNDLNYIINDYPYFDLQFMAYPREHRPRPDKKDLYELVFLTTISNNTAMMNMKNSGASIEDHVHYQCINEKLPIEENNSKKPSLYQNDDLRIMRTTSPIYYLSLDWNTPTGMWEVFNIVQNCKAYFNLHVLPTHINLIPRKTNYSHLAPNWKIGCAEVGGLFLATEPELFERLNHKMLKEILSEVTFNEDEAKLFEEELYKGFIRDLDLR